MRGTKRNLILKITCIAIIHVQCTCNDDIDMNIEIVLNCSSK